jgi:hypothetical protein
MVSISVQENLDRINKCIDDFKKELDSIESRKNEIEDELLRLEGCLITFSGFKEAGIESIRPDSENKTSCTGSDENHTHRFDINESNESQSEWTKEFRHIQ